MKKKNKPPKPAQQGPETLQNLPKMSETLLQFGKPLLDKLGPTPTIDELTSIMVMVTTVWNLPVYESRTGPEAEALIAQWNEIAPNIPPEFRQLLEGMLATRKTRYANDPRLGFAEVVEGPEGELKIVATFTV